MNIRSTKRWFVAGATLLAMTAAGGVALAVAPGDWYEGGNASRPDPHLLSTPLHLYGAGGAAVTSGSTTGPLAAFAAADGAVRTGDQFGTLFVHAARSDTAPGAWAGLQVTGTDRFAGTDAISHPASLDGKPLVGIGSTSYDLDDAIAALASPAGNSDALKNVYELRLRTSSATAGVSDVYAATWVRVNPAAHTWQEIGKPDLGGGSGTTTPPTTTPPAGAVGTSVAPGWPASLTYGTPASVSVTVSPASGSAKPTGAVRLVNGAATVASGTLANGAATLSIPAAALTPGSVSLKVVYAGASGTWGASESAARAFTVAKAVPGQPTYKTDKAPTTKKAGAATVTVPTPAGLAAAGGTAKVVLTKGKVTKTVTVTVSGGKATVKLPKLLKGKWKVVVTYDGDADYASATSSSYTLKVKAPKKKK